MKDGDHVENNPDDVIDDLDSNDAIGDRLREVIQKRAKRKEAEAPSEDPFIETGNTKIIPPSTRKNPVNTTPTEEGAESAAAAADQIMAEAAKSAARERAAAEQASAEIQAQVDAAQNEAALVDEFILKPEALVTDDVENDSAENPVVLEEPEIVDLEAEDVDLSEVRGKVEAAASEEPETIDLKAEEVQILDESEETVSEELDDDQSLNQQEAGFFAGVRQNLRNRVRPNLEKIDLNKGVLGLGAVLALFKSLFEKIGEALVGFRSDKKESVLAEENTSNRSFNVSNNSKIDDFSKLVEKYEQKPPLGWWSRRMLSYNDGKVDVTARLTGDALPQLDNGSKFNAKERYMALMVAEGKMKSEDVMAIMTDKYGSKDDAVQSEQEVSQPVAEATNEQPEFHSVDLSLDQPVSEIVSEHPQPDMMSQEVDAQNEVPADPVVSENAEDSLLEEPVSEIPGMEEEESIQFRSSRQRPEEENNGVVTSDEKTSQPQAEEQPSRSDVFYDFMNDKHASKDDVVESEQEVFQPVTEATNEQPSRSDVFDVLTDVNDETYDNETSPTDEQVLQVLKARKESLDATTEKSSTVNNEGQKKMSGAEEWDAYVAKQRGNQQVKHSETQDKIEFVKPEKKQKIVFRPGVAETQKAHNVARRKKGPYKPGKGKNYHLGL